MATTPLTRRRRARRRRHVHHHHNRRPAVAAHRCGRRNRRRGRWECVAADCGWLRGPGAVHAGQRLRGPWGRQTSAAIAPLHVADGPSPRSCAIVHQCCRRRRRRCWLSLVYLPPFLVSLLFARVVTSFSISLSLECSSKVRSCDVSASQDCVTVFARQLLEPKMLADAATASEGTRYAFPTVQTSAAAAASGSR